VAGSREGGLRCEHQLIGSFRGRIQADCEWLTACCSRMAGSGCLIGPMAAALHQWCQCRWWRQPSRIERKAHHIAVTIGHARFSILSRNARLGGQMDHAFHPRAKPVSE